MRTWSFRELDGGDWHQLELFADGRFIAAIRFDDADQRKDAYADFQFIVDACNEAEEEREIESRQTYHLMKAWIAAAREINPEEARRLTLK